MIGFTRLLQGQTKLKISGANFTGVANNDTYN